MMISIICLLYCFGFTVIIKSARRKGKMITCDLIMLLIAPCFVLPVILMALSSMFMDIDSVVKRFD